MTKFLVPLDGSNTSEAILPWAKFFIDNDKSVKLLRCLHPLASLYSFADFATPPPTSLDPMGYHRFAQKYFESITSEHELEVETEVVEGEPADTIVAQSKDDDVDYILLLSHGSGGLGKWLLGSTAAKVVKASTKPVIVVRPGEKAAQPQLNKILVCLDGSKLAERGLEVAAELAKDCGAELMLYRVIDHTPYPVADIQAVLMEASERATEYLNQQAAKFPDLKIEVACEISSIVGGVLKKSADYDMVVLTSHGYSGFTRWIMGSVAEALLQRCKTPVMVVQGAE